MELLHAIWEFINIPVIKLMLLIGCIRVGAEILIKKAH